MMDATSLRAGAVTSTLKSLFFSSERYSILFEIEKRKKIDVLAQPVSAIYLYIHTTWLLLFLLPKSI